MKQKRYGRIGLDRHDLVRQRIAEGQSAIEIGEELNVFHETIRKFARKRGLKIQRHDMNMENHPSWKGGTTKDRQGYELQRVEADGPYGYLIRAIRAGDRRGYAPTHRIVMHEKLGREIQPGEVVHHVDGDISNNDPSNLELFASNGEHLAKTLKGKLPNWTPEGYSRIGKRQPPDPLDEAAQP